jgi:hypothetical protein
MDSGQMGPARQYFGACMGSVLRGILAFPAFLACHWRVDELRWSDHGCYHLPCSGRLVHTWTQAVRVAAG